jgi:ParB family chromosome partitioning protein
MRLALDRIAVGRRLRKLNPARVRAYAEDRAALDNPILVRPLAVARGGADHELVAGGHRLEAARQLALADIAVVIKDLDDNHAILAQIDENLQREELSALDRAIFLSERKRVWEAIHPEARRGGDRRSPAAQDAINRQSLPFGFSREAAEAIGLSERTIRDAVALVAALGADAEKLQGTAIADNASDLKALARLEAAKRAKVVARLAAGEARFAGALAAAGLGKPPVDGQEQVYRALVSMWSRANSKTRKRFLAGIGERTE